MTTRRAHGLPILLCIILSLLLQPLSAVYLNETLLIHIDVSIRVTVAQLLQSATANIQQIVETAFQDSSENPIYSITSILEIESISNSSSCIYSANTFRHQTLLRLLFSTHSQFDSAINKYEYIFANDLTNFIQIFESNTFAQLLRALNTDGLPSDTVLTHSLNMFKANMIFKYNDNARTNMVTSTTATPSPTSEPAQKSETTATALSSFLSLDYQNQTNVIIAIALVCICILCCCLTCFWCRVRAKRHQSKRRQSMHKQQTAVSIRHNKQRKHSHADREEIEIVNGTHSALKAAQSSPPHSAVPSADPYDWGTADVGRWLLSIGLQRYRDPLNDINGRKLLKSLNAYRLEHIYGILNSKDVELLMARIEILRLKSSAYQNWRNETRKLYAPKNASKNNQKNGKSRHFRQKTQPVNFLREYRYNHANVNRSDDDNDYMQEDLEHSLQKAADREERTRTITHHMAKDSASNLPSSNFATYKQVHPLPTAEALILNSSKQQTVHNNNLYFRSDDESSSSSSPQEGDDDDEEKKDEAEDRSQVKTPRKPPKRLRRRASTKRKNESMSMSSTMEVASPKHSLSKHRHSSLQMFKKTEKKVSVQAKRTQSHQIKRRPQMPPSEKRRKAMNRYESSEGTGESETEPVKEDTVEIRSDPNKMTSSSDEDTY